MYTFPKPLDQNKIYTKTWLLNLLRYLHRMSIIYLAQIVNRDNILGEDPASKFDDAYLIEGYIENPEGFDGEGDLYSKFGLEIRDEASFIISRKIWNNRIGYE